jgi:serine/threonine protein kinase
MSTANPAVNTEVPEPNSEADNFACSPALRGFPQQTRYAFLSVLGAGGMGEVFLARDTQLDRQVALKILPKKHAQNGEWLRRFEREAKAASALNHPNIMTIHEFAIADGQHYIATEFIEGDTLRGHLQQGGMPIATVLNYALQIASALAAAHASGLVHRDIKPENIMVRPDGYLKLLDFGLAKATTFAVDAGQSAEYAAQNDTQADDFSTEPGFVIGTTLYMSPEQICGLNMDARSDVFSFGVLLYEMCAGQLPFEGKSASDLMIAILDRQPTPICTLNENAPPELDQIVAKALQKEPNDRYSAIKLMHADLLALQLELAGRNRSAAFSASNQGAKAVHASQPAAQTPATTWIQSKVLSRSELPPARSGYTSIETPEVRYALSGEVNIAYQVIGEGELDLVFVMGWISHLEYFWSEPSFAKFLRRLAGFSRVILFDKRGTGLSDRVPIDQLPTLEQRMDDVRAVMDAAGSKSAVLCGVSEGGPMCSLFAATYPEKTIALVMMGSYARRIQGEGYPWGPTHAQRDAFLEHIRSQWGGPVGIEDRAPSMANDPAFRTWWASYLRHGASPSAAVALTRMNSEIDIRHVLPGVRVPTLVLHRSGDTCLRVEEGRYLAEHIPGAKFVELAGIDHLPFVGVQDDFLDEIEDFLTGVRHDSDNNRVLATVLSVWFSAPDHEINIEKRAQFLQYAQRKTSLFKGQLITASGKRLTDLQNSRNAAILSASFDGPARAIRAASDIAASAQRFELSIAIGLHTGECELNGEQISGPALEIAHALGQLAPAGAVWVSSTVKDLVAGSGITFETQGSRALSESGSGAALGSWQLFSVRK